MIKLAICDDEPVYQKEVARLAKEYGEYHHVELSISVYSSGVQVLDANEHYDIFILDILMPGLSGMELASDLRRMDDAASIIFLTSSPEFAIEGYSVHALAYLLKPVKREKLFKILYIMLAGTPPTIVYGATSFVTTARVLIMAPSPIVTPDMITAS